MAKTVVGLLDSMDEAQNVVRDLVNSGFRRDDISIMANDSERRFGGEAYEGKSEGAERAEGAATGAGTGAAVGGIAGLVVGLTGLAIPGIGPIIAAGPLASLLAGAGVGAVAGGAIGALTKLGVSEEDAQYYAEGVRRGGFLVTVAANDTDAETAAATMRRHGAVDIDKRAESWRREGTGFGEKETAYQGIGTRVDTSLTSSGRESTRFSHGTHPTVDDDDDFRSHFSSTYGTTSGEGFESYRSAYHYAEGRSGDPRFSGKDWREVEEDFHQDWERSHPGTWAKVKDAVHYGWNKNRSRAH